MERRKIAFSLLLRIGRKNFKLEFFPISEWVDEIGRWQPDLYRLRLDGKWLVPAGREGEQRVFATFEAWTRYLFEAMPEVGELLRPAPGPCDPSRFPKGVCVLAPAREHVLAGRVKTWTRTLPFQDETGAWRVWLFDDRQVECNPAYLDTLRLA